MKRAVIIINVLFGLSLLIWLVVAYGSIFLVTAHGSDNSSTWSLAWSIWTYPLTYLVALIGSIISYRSKASNKITLGFALLPLINIVWFLGSIALIEFV